MKRIERIEPGWNRIFDSVSDEWKKHQTDAEMICIILKIFLTHKISNGNKCDKILEILIKKHEKAHKFLCGICGEALFRDPDGTHLFCERECYLDTENLILYCSKKCTSKAVGGFCRNSSYCEAILRGKSWKNTGYCSENCYRVALWADGARD